MSEAGTIKVPEAKAGKTSGDFHAPPPPDRPKEWKALGILQYKDNTGLFEFRVVSTVNLSEELRGELHDKHGIAAVSWEKNK